jgi:hypothetical protein
VCAHGLVGVLHAALDDLEGCGRAFVNNLYVFFVEGDIRLEELRNKLKFLLNLRLRDVEVFTF